jgi:diaminopimelate epimerase
MRFTKMHGIGNDYVYVNCFEEKLPMAPERLSELVSDRHFGIGSDGLILIKPSQKAFFAMDIYNADGSRAMMCGNGIRCVAKYVYDHGMTNMTDFTVETLAGIKKVGLTVKDGVVSRVSVDMGLPMLTSNRADLGLTPEAYEGCLKAPEKVWELLELPDGARRMIGISMGNPHAVFFMEALDGLDIEKDGPVIEKHERFEDRTNVEFIQVVDRGNIRMRVWERGSGETMACGTGACASAVAAMLAGFTDNNVDVRLLGGTLNIRRNELNGHVVMTGPATEVFRGDFDV